MQIVFTAVSIIVYYVVIQIVCVAVSIIASVVVSLNSRFRMLEKLFKGVIVLLLFCLYNLDSFTFNHTHQW